MKWTEEEYKLHLKSVKKLSRVKDEAFEFISKKIRIEQKLTDYRVQQFILKRFKKLDLETELKPIVAVDKNSSDPHYTPTAKHKTYIQKGSWVLIDIWAKEKTKRGIFADITWVGYVGKKVPKKHQEVFDLVLKARDAALRFLKRKVKEGEEVRGWQMDKVARDVIKKGGFGKFFIHGLGHSLGYKVHEDGVAFRSLKVKDRRRIVSRCGYTIEPGIYLRDFGVRSEINIFLRRKHLEVTTPVQKEILRL